MTSPNTHYFPALKGKEGELRALGEVSVEERALFTPILEVPIIEDSDPSTALDEIDKLAKKIGDYWSPGHRLIVDALGAENVLRAGEPVVSDLHAVLRLSVDAVPTIGLSVDLEFVAAVADIAEQDGNGVCLRVTTADMEDTVALGEAVIRMLAQLRVGPANVDLVLDAGAVTADTVPLYSSVLTSVLALMPHVEEWRSLVVLSGAFPQNLGEVTTGVLSRLPRLDAQLWRRLVERKLPRRPSFGDFAVSHPRIASTGGRRGAPNLRYTGDDQWFALKGKLDGPQGNKTFFGICAQLRDMKNSPLEQAEYSWGDQNIQRCASSRGGPGGGSEWRAWNTSHHLRKVTDRLSTHGEP